MANKAAGKVTKLLVEVSDSGISEEALAEASEQIRSDLAQLDVQGVTARQVSRVPEGAKVVESLLLGSLLVKLVASGGTLTAIASVARDWVKGRAARGVTLQYGKDKLTIKGASSKEQERAFSEWISRHSNPATNPAEKKQGEPEAQPKQAAKKTRAATKKTHAKRTAAKKVGAGKKSVRRSSSRTRSTTTGH